MNDFSVILIGCDFLNPAHRHDLKKTRDILRSLRQAGYCVYLYSDRCAYRAEYSGFLDQRMPLESVQVSLGVPLHRIFFVTVSMDQAKKAREGGVPYSLVFGSKQGVSWDDLPMICRRRAEKRTASEILRQTFCCGCDTC